MHTPEIVGFGFIVLIVLAVFWPRHKEDRDIAEEASFQAWHDAVTTMEREGGRKLGVRFYDELDLVEYEDKYITEDYTDYALQCQRAGYKPIGAVHWARLSPTERKYEIAFMLHKQGK